MTEGFLSDKACQSKPWKGQCAGERGGHTAVIPRIITNTDTNIIRDTGEALSAVARVGNTGIERRESGWRDCRCRDPQDLRT